MIGGSGYSAAIKITNISSKTIEDWILDFDFNKEITDIWNGVIIDHTGIHYKIKNASYNQNIEPGSTIFIGFNGNNGNIVESPSNYILTETVVCNTEYDQLPDGRIDRDYLYNAIYPNLVLKGLPVDNVQLSDDYDMDGLTLAQEYEYDTNPFLVDSDEDGLDDFDEINLYRTNPIMRDTDSDNMIDGTEAYCGLDPLKIDSDEDGILNSEEIITQNVRIESVNEINISETLVKPQVTITGKGDFSRQIFVEDINDNVMLSELDYIVGHPFDFIHDDNLEFEMSVLSFAIDPSVLLNNDLGELAIAFYDTELN